MNHPYIHSLVVNSITSQSREFAASEDISNCDHRMAALCMIVHGCFCSDLITDGKDKKAPRLNEAFWDSNFYRDGAKESPNKNGHGETQKGRESGLRDLTQNFGGEVSFSMTPPQEQNERWLIPESSGSYYLEGPQKGSIADSKYRDAMDSAFALDGGHGFFGKRPGHFKRTQPEGDTVAKAIQGVALPEPRDFDESQEEYEIELPKTEGIR
ncbi:hypothetical protein TWF281_007543 [Arthrobotrys megalospora]